MYKPLILLVEIPRKLSLNKTFKEELWYMLEKINEHNITIVVTTTYLDEIKRCKKIVLMDKGKILLVDSWHNLKDKVESETFPYKDILPKLMEAS